ncbi:MAG: DNA recombination protein RmuC [Candidatus Magasanikbacteria bacterium]|nr:DNA recombination protein RmuC [Candidatus Magasanikbacteria bacterium]
MATVFIAILAVLLLVLRRLSAPPPPQAGEQNMFLMMQQQLQELSRLVDQKIGDTHKTMQETQQNLNKTIQSQFGQSMKIITDVTEKLTKLDETNKQVMGFAEQLENLEQILQNPKQRGILGEYYLENVLKNVLPPGTYQMQYAFPDGDIVDAAIFVKEKIIPVDAKFSLENYNRAVAERDPTRKSELEAAFKRDLKQRIDETGKYIKPKAGTMDFAFMFIPAEGIYYDLLINKVGAIKINTHDLIEYAFRERHVIIVSPTSFLAYLQTVLQGLRALQIEESAKEIRERVEELGKHLLAYDEYLKKLGGHLSTTVNTYNTAYKEFNKIDKDVMRITGGEKRVEVLQIEKPTVETE